MFPTSGQDDETCLIWIPGYEHDAEERDTAQQHRYEVWHPPAPPLEDEQGGQVGGDLEDATQGEVQVDVRATSQLAHVQRQAEVGKGVDKPIIK